MISHPAEDASAALRTWAEQLACPVCHAKLVLDQTRILCRGCGRAYPVEDGIGVLIAERAEPSSLA